MSFQLHHLHLHRSARTFALAIALCLPLAAPTAYASGFDLDDIVIGVPRDKGPGGADSPSVDAADVVAPGQPYVVYRQYHEPLISDLGVLNAWLAGLEIPVFEQDLFETDERLVGAPIAVVSRGFIAGTMSGLALTHCADPTFPDLPFIDEGTCPGDGAIIAEQTFSGNLLVQVEFWTLEETPSGDDCTWSEYGTYCLESSGSLVFADTLDYAAYLEPGPQGQGVTMDLVQEASYVAYDRDELLDSLEDAVLEAAVSSPLFYDLLAAGLALINTEDFADALIQETAGAAVGWAVPVTRALVWTDVSDQYDVTLPFAVQAGAPWVTTEVRSLGFETQGFGEDHLEVTAALVYTDADVVSAVGYPTLDDTSSWPFGMGIPESYPNALYAAGHDQDAFEWEITGATVAAEPAFQGIVPVHKTFDASLSLGTAPRVEFEGGAPTLRFSDATLLVQAAHGAGAILPAVSVTADVHVPLTVELRNGATGTNDRIVLVPDTSGSWLSGSVVASTMEGSPDTAALEHGLAELVAEWFVADLPILRQGFNKGVLASPAESIAEVAAEGGWLNVYFEHDDATLLQAIPAL